MRKNNVMCYSTAALLTVSLLAGCGSAPADSTPASSAAEVETSAESTIESADSDVSDTTEVDLAQIFADNALEKLLAKYETVTVTTQYTYNGDEENLLNTTVQYTTKDGCIISHGSSTETSGDGNGSYATYADSEEPGVYLYSTDLDKMVTVYDSAETYKSQSTIAFLPTADDVTNMTVTNVSTQDGATLIETETVVDGERAISAVYYIDPTTGNLLADSETYYDGDTITAESVADYDYTTAYDDTENLYGSMLNVDGGRNVTIVFGAGTGEETSRTLTVDANTTIGLIGSNDEVLYADIEGKELLSVVESGTEDVTVYALPDTSDKGVSAG